MACLMIGTSVLISITIPNKIFGEYSKALAPQYNPLESLSDNPTISEIKLAISYVAKKYLVDESQLMQVIKCESSYRTNAVGDDGLAYGLLQFHKPTFDKFCEGNYYSAKDQLVCAAKMWSQNEKNKLHWSCWKKYFSK